jgi:hypothetical protein
MSFTTDVYHAVLGANQPAEQFTAFNVDPSGPPRGRPCATDLAQLDMAGSAASWDAAAPSPSRAY